MSSEASRRTVGQTVGQKNGQGGGHIPGKGRGGALAIAAVTAALRGLLENAVADGGVLMRLGADVVVSALPPDRIQTGAEEKPQINIFLYQVTPRSALSRPLPTFVFDPKDGSKDLLSQRPAAPPIALDLSYLVTAYGGRDLQMEVLLGQAVAAFQETPALSSGRMAEVLQTLERSESGRIVAPTVAALPEDKSETALTIAPLFLSGEEMSRLWSTLQSKYRPSIAFKVSSVVIGEAQ